MKIVPCLYDVKSEKIQYYQFHIEQNLKCRHAYLSDVTFELRDSFGKLIQFSDNASTCIVLKFTSYNKV